MNKNKVPIYVTRWSIQDNGLIRVLSVPPSSLMDSQEVLVQEHFNISSLRIDGGDIFRTREDAIKDFAKRKKEAIKECREKIKMFTKYIKEIQELSEKFKNCREGNGDWPHNVEC